MRDTHDFDFRVSSTEGFQTLRRSNLQNNRVKKQYKGINNDGTKLTKMIRSSGTPCSMRTSTAFMADPPVAVHHETPPEVRHAAIHTQHRVQEKHVSFSDVLRELRYF